MSRPSLIRAAAAALALATCAAPALAQSVVPGLPPTTRATPAAGTEAAVRRTIAELAKGEPSYDLMSAQMAEVTKQQLPALQELFTGLGAVESVSFVGGDPQGAPPGTDIYNVKLANGAVLFVISLDDAGKMVGAGVVPAGPPPQ